MEIERYNKILLAGAGTDYSEDKLQQVCVMMFRNTYPHLRFGLFSVPNGGLRNRREAALLKTTGLTSGVSDLILVRKKPVFLELKRFKKGGQSIAQREFEAYVNSQGFDYYLIRTLEDFWFVIKKHI